MVARPRHRIIVTVVAAVLLVQAAWAQQSSDTRATMRGLYEALSTALLMSLDEQQFQDPANREQILMSLRRLSANANRLERHAGEFNESYDYLRRSLARDCREAAERFDQGQYVGTRFVLTKLTENCVTCHSKRVAAGEPDLARGFMADAKIQRLPPEERMKLQIATRLFDDAMETCEQILRNEETIADHVAVTGILEDYLKLAIRVKRDRNRAITTLEAFAARPDVPGYMRDMIGVWVDALREIDFDLPPDRRLSGARRLIREAQGKNLFPTDRRALVHYVAASGLLQSYVGSRPRSKQDLAEAYYLMGFVEAHISRSYWVSETEFFLERSIRIAPRAKSARKAYDLLEAYTVMGYSGSAGMMMPPDVRKNLDELEALIDGS